MACQNYRIELSGVRNSWHILLMLEYSDFSLLAASSVSLNLCQLTKHLPTRRDNLGDAMGAKKFTFFGHPVFALLSLGDGGSCTPFDGTYPRRRERGWHVDFGNCLGAPSCFFCCPCSLITCFFVFPDFHCDSQDFGAY